MGGRVGRSRRYERQTSRDVQRAVSRVSRVRGLTTDESTEALRGRAVRTGVSVHAAALAVMATSPTDELVTSGADLVDRQGRAQPDRSDRSDRSVRNQR